MVFRERVKRPLLLLSLSILLAAVWAGWIRIGWAWPSLVPRLPVSHGPLMVSGFLGSLIAIERVVALETVLPWTNWRKTSLYVGPVLTLVGGFLLLGGETAVFGPILIAIGSFVLVLIFVLIVKMHPALHTGVMALGTIAWFVGNALWLAGRPIHFAVWWWAAFLVFTIAGERLELSRVVRLTKLHQQLFGVASGVLLLGLVWSIFQYSMGLRVVGVGYLLLGAWLLRFDIARRTMRQQGLTQFIGICLFTGYIWLLASGVLLIWIGGVSAGLLYDAILHTVFLGFVFAMIFGHAPIIFPSILGIQLAYRPAFYIHLVLLHVTLLLRVIGDLTAWIPGRQWGGLLNGIVLLIFLGNTILSLRQGLLSKNLANHHF